MAFRISAVDRLSKDTYLVRFALPGNSQLGLRPGQHLILRYTQAAGGPSFAAVLCQVLAAWSRATCFTFLKPPSSSK